MKYVLVNKFDEIVSTVDLAGNVGKTGATTYFQGVKNMPEKEDFDKLWKVMSELEYQSIYVHYQGQILNYRQFCM